MPDALHLGASDAGAVCLPYELLTTMTSIVGRRGSGKTTTGSVVAEEYVGAGLPFVFLDPLGVAWGLRSSVDGERPGLPVTILGGAHGDLPIQETAGRLVAELVVEQPGAYIIDFSAFESRSAEKRFAADFAERLYRLKAHDTAALGLIVDEADTFAPQQAQGDDKRMLGAFEAIARRGRSRGLGMVAITQRPAVLNKNVGSQAELLIAHQVTSPHDREALKAWVEGNATKAEVETFLASLASLKVGEAWLWSPAWLQLFERIQIRRRRTFDSSATPKAGEIRVEPRVLAPVDLDALRQRMAETIERAAESDPKALRQRIVELEAAVRNERTVEVQPCGHEAELAALREAAHRRQTTLIQIERELSGERQRTAALEKRSQTLRHALASLGHILAGLELDAEEETPHAEGAGDSLPGPLSPLVREVRRAGQSTATMRAVRSTKPTLEGRGRDTEDMKDEEVVELVRRELRAAMELAGRVLVVPPKEALRHEFQQRAVDQVMKDVSLAINESLPYEAMRFMLAHDESMAAARLSAGLRINNIQSGNALKVLSQAGLIAKVSGGGGGVPISYRPCVREWVGKALAPHSPPDAEVEETYQAVLGRIAGGAP